MAKDAPRALSDAFLAVAAAVFFDSDWITFCRVFIDTNGPIGECLCRLFKWISPVVKTRVLDPVAHLKELAAQQYLDISFQSLDLSMPSVGIAGDDVVQQALDTALNRDPCRKCWNKKALVRDSGPVSIQVAAGLRDLHCCQLCIRGFAVGPSVSASSPRSAERRCAALALQSKDLEQSASSSIGVIRDALMDIATPNNATPNDETRRALLRRLKNR